MGIDDRGLAAFRFHHDGSDALILSEREREGACVFFRNLFQGIDGRLKQLVRTKEFAGRVADRKIKAHIANPFPKALL